MLNNGSKRSKIIRAAMRLAEKKGWRALTLSEIARSAGVGLGAVHKRFANKMAILDAFSREVDRAVLAKVAPAEEEGPRDRLFDVLMTRLEVLAPYKPALKRIAADLRTSPLLAAGLCGASARAQYWMLTAAGIDADGPEACLRVPGLMALQARIMPVWLEDDDPGLARTMAVLDRQLRRGEKAMGVIEDVCGAVERLACAFIPRRRRTGSAQPSKPGAEPTRAG